MPIDPEAAGQALAHAVRDSGKLTILTGAGISAESGVKTFRDMGGLWETHRVEDVATPEGYRRNPALVLDFYNARRAQLPGVVPNPAHRALAVLEATLAERFTLITQNVDDLHERGGSQQVWHMHGELLKARCSRCETVYPWPGPLNLGDVSSCCRRQLRPHIVWFGEMPFYLDEVIPRALAGATFLSIGTSGTVYPAAGFVDTVHAQGGVTAELNLEPSANAESFTYQVMGKAGEMLPRLVAAFMAAL